jgi:hypothetical protein
MRRGLLSRITYRECPRCGKTVAGLVRPIAGSKACHAKYAGLCDGCVTAEERREIEADILGGVLAKCGGGKPGE